MRKIIKIYLKMIINCGILYLSLRKAKIQKANSPKYNTH